MPDELSLYRIDYSYYCYFMKKACTFIFLFICVLSSAQVVDADLISRAKKGDPQAGYQVALAYDKTNDGKLLRETIKLLENAAEKNYHPAQALLAYHYLKGAGVNRNVDVARQLAATSASSGDNGFAYWILQKTFRDQAQSYQDYVLRAFQCRYPQASLLFARLYAEGSEEYGIAVDKSLADDLIKEAACYRVPYAAAIEGPSLLVEGHDSTKAYEYLKLAADAEISNVYPFLACLYYNGVGTNKDEDTAYQLYEKAADLGDPVGIEAVADFYRLGSVVQQDMVKSFSLYKSVSTNSPRAKYLQACYMNDGVGTDRDQAKALELFAESAESGYIFSQAVLGISYYTGDAPCVRKDYVKAYSFLSKALANDSFDDLPDDFKSKVYEYAAACLRYGLGVEMNAQEADKLLAKSTELRSGISFSRAPFGFVGGLAFKDVLAVAEPIKPADIPDSILDEFVLDYPLDVQKRSSPLPSPVPVQEKDPSLVFGDLKVEELLVNLYDKSGDGKLTDDELISVESLDGLKMDNNITSFDEFAYFTSIKQIPQMCFQGLEKMVSIRLPESLTTISDGAFLGCSSLTKIVIPASVTNIGSWAFANCGKLRSIVCAGKEPPTVGDNFIAYSGDLTIYVPSEAVDTYKHASGWRDLAKHIKAIPSEIIY